jgi:type III pantothenate kinase
LVVSSVGDVEKQSFLEYDNRVNVHFLNHDDPFPFNNSYATPATLGIDRMVLAAGATLQFPMNRLLSMQERALLMILLILKIII